MKTTFDTQETECLRCGKKYPAELLRCHKCGEPNYKHLLSAQDRARNAIQRLDRIRSLAATAPVEDAEKSFESQPLKSAYIAESALREIGESLPTSIIRELACRVK